MDIKNKIYGGAKMQEKEEIEISKEELFEIVKRLGSEVIELRFELQIANQEIERLQRLINSLTDYIIKKTIQK
jgi:hypothetical protein